MVQQQKPSERIAIIGSGGIGGYLAGQLHAAGHDVTLCARTPFDKLVITEAKDGSETTVPVRIATDPSAEEPAKWILVTTKAQDVPSAAPWLEHLTGPESRIIVVQNGIDHEERVRPFLPADATVVPSSIICAVERRAPGHILHHGHAKISVPGGPIADELTALFSGSAFEIIGEDDFLTVAWGKLLTNAMVNPITSLTLRRSAVLADSQVAELARAIGREVVAVAKATGAKLSDGDIEGPLARLAGSPTGGSSMLYDRLAGRPLEYAFITGAVVAAAEKHGIDVPVNRTILALLKGASGHSLDGAN
ncbi:2-dehydropantoate 2-reductase [Tianweitania sp. BSSL-BM11]|uniref:2-dehydropantoate 2-reductase n=1 Tax=Tianweitania aestuarii TaxID=2814886 RepID=A0ABS5RY82_9HYPH|nr:2-dehydropantoate 2-reductase [Tianweitania aestuarii]MBS9721942.1 2-dehydropantoate 2-reductase [Tianweitania aestuarii]